MKDNSSKKKRDQPEAPAEESARLYSIIQVSGTSNEKKELAITLSRDAIQLDVCNFDTVEKERRTIVSMNITNLKALRRFRAILDIAIKTIEQ